MQTGYVEITGDNCFEEVNACIKQECNIGYEKELTGGILYCLEEEKFLSAARFMVVITIEKVDSGTDNCAVEIIVGGGKFDLFSINSGMERNYIRKINNRLVDFCNSLGFEISIPEEQ